MHVCITELTTHTVCVVSSVKTCNVQSCRNTASLRGLGVLHQLDSRSLPLLLHHQWKTERSANTRQQSDWSERVRETFKVTQLGGRRSQIAQKSYHDENIVGKSLILITLQARNDSVREREGGSWSEEERVTEEEALPLA